ncbi:uncharacterized protein LOC107307584 isoform X2 [Coturnix japonica]|uniref:uncharacterized protein LOC107307584 isoform X2 n=1 Tax=Coturnix japonica TaxID=93934 RepID=UPI0007770A84|nr:uncharacterized protein LOC107307584 isoform X2 [Coturnix japonica]
MCSKETCAAPWRAPAADDDVGVPYPDVLVDTDFVPQGKPRGPLGGLPEWRPVPEPGVDARGTDAEPAHRDAFQQGIRRTLPIPLGEREASQAAGTPALSNPGEAHHNWVYRFLRNPGVPGAGRANAEQVKVGWKFYLILAGASLGSLLLGMLLCWLLIYWYRNRK